MDDNPFTPTPEQLATLERLKPLRIVLSKDAEGRYVGLTEESFAMYESRERVLMWWSGKAYSMLGEHKIDAINDVKRYAQNPHYEVHDPLDPACPVDINWRFWLEALKAGRRRKYDSRNAPFTEKD